MKSVEKVDCVECGTSILKITSKTYGGRCAPCAQGRRRAVDQAKKSVREKIEIVRRVDSQCIGLLKDFENCRYADYYFTAAVYDRDPRYKEAYMVVSENRGIVRIHKETGEFELMAAMEGDEGNRRFEKAGYKLRKHWELGEYPDASMYASG